MLLLLHVYGIRRGWATHRTHDHIGHVKGAHVVRIVVHAWGHDRARGADKVLRHIVA